MRKFLLSFITLIFAIGIITSFSACTNKDDSQKASEEASSLIESPAPEEPYTISYTSNDNGTCYVSEVRLNNKCESISVVIPETSPDGDTVTEYRCNSLASQNVPLIISAADYEARILIPLREKQEGASSSDSWNMEKILVYHLFISLENATDIEKERLLKEFPILAATPIYVIGMDISSAEFHFLSEGLYQYIDFGIDDNIECTQNLNKLAQKHSIDWTATQVNDISSVISVTLPDTIEYMPSHPFSGCINMESLVLSSGLKEVSASIITNCPKIQLNEHDNALYLGTKENPYFAFMIPKEQNIELCKVHQDTKIMSSFEFRDTKGYKVNAIIIPEPIISIPYNDHWYFSVDTIYYCGNKEQLEKALKLPPDYTIGDVRMSTDLYTYSETQPTTNGYFWHMVDSVPTVWE